MGTEIFLQGFVGRQSRGLHLEQAFRLTHLTLMDDKKANVGPQLLKTLEKTVETLGPLSADQLPSRLRRQLLSHVDGEYALNQLLQRVSTSKRSTSDD